MCVLLLRGPQTVGELRGRTERLYSFSELAYVEATLEGLIERALVVKLPRQSGRKDSRYAHLLAGPVEVEEGPPRSLRVEPAMVAVRAENERIAQLTDEVAALRNELNELRQQFSEFKKQFD